MIKFLKILIYIIILSVDILAMRFFHSYELFVMAVIMVVFPVVFEVLFFIGAGRTKIDIILEKYEITREENINIKIKCKNYFVTGYLNFKLNIGSIYYDKYEDKKTMSLLTFFGGQCKIPVAFENVGKYEISLKDIYISDLFGIFTKKISKKFSVNINVMPKLNESNLLKLGDNEIDLNWAIKNFTASEGDIQSVREYIKGDRLNSINWKQSARKDEIMVKEYEKSGSDEYIILFDFSLQCLDLSFDNFYSLSKRLIDEKKSFYVMWQIRGNEDLLILHITNEKSLIKFINNLFVSYPVYSEKSIKNAFKRKFPNSCAVYVGRVEELM